MSTAGCKRCFTLFLKNKAHSPIMKRLNAHNHRSHQWRQSWSEITASSNLLQDQLRGLASVLSPKFKVFPADWRILGITVALWQRDPPLFRHDLDLLSCSYQCEGTINASDSPPHTHTELIGRVCVLLCSFLLLIGIKLTVRSCVFGGFWEPWLVNSCLNWSLIYHMSNLFILFLHS